MTGRVLFVRAYVSAYVGLSLLRFMFICSTKPCFIDSQIRVVYTMASAFGDFWKPD